MSDGSRKRKLPSCLGLGPSSSPPTAAANHGRPAADTTPSAHRDTESAQPAGKRRATEATVRQMQQHRRAAESPAAAAIAAGIAAAMARTSDRNVRQEVAVSDARPILLSPSPPALVPIDSPVSLPESESPPPAASIKFTTAAGGKAAAAGISIVPRPLLLTRPLPPAFSPHPPVAPFPLLDLPTDLLSLLPSFLWIWDAFFLRCTCKAMRRVSGLNGGVIDEPLDGKQKRRTSQSRRSDPSQDDTKLKRRLSRGRSSQSQVAVQATSQEIDAAATQSIPASLDFSLSVEPMDLTADQSFTSAAASSPAPSAAPSSVAVAPLVESDDDRFWHQYTSLDFRVLLGGWREFEARRAKYAEEITRRAGDDSSDHGGEGDAAAAGLGLSPSPAPNTIMIFDSDEEGTPLARTGDSPEAIDEDIDGGSTFHMRGLKPADRRSSSSTSRQANRSPSPLLTDSKWRIDIYQRLQRSVSAYLHGTPRLRSGALTSVGSSGEAEDLSTTSEEDVWLMHFLSTHRLPFISHIHFAYVTLHSALLQHLQSFCCSYAGGGGGGYGSTAGVGSVKEMSVQYSEKSAGGGRWLDTLCGRGFGRLERLSLDLSIASKTLSLSPLTSLTHSLTGLTLIGPTTAVAALPRSILDSLSATLPNLRHLTVAHALQTSQEHLVQACQNITRHQRWRQLRSLTIIHWPKVEQLLPLIEALRTCTHFRQLEAQACVNVKLPVIELPKKPKPATTAAGSTKKKVTGGKASQKNDTVVAMETDEDDDPALASSSKQAVASSSTIPLSAAPRLVQLSSWTFSQCSSLTVPSLRSLGLMCPNLTALALTDYAEGKLIGGSALKLLFDPLLFSSLRSLNLANCPYLDDRALEALPKKTRMVHLRVLNLSLARSYSQRRPGGAAAASAKRNLAGLHPADGRLTDYGLTILVVYCPLLSTLHLSRQTAVTPGAIVRATRQWTHLECLHVQHLSLDGAWLVDLWRLPITHACTVHASLSPTLLRSANAFLTDAPRATAAADSTTPNANSATLGRLPSQLSANTSNGALLRSLLAQQLQQRMETLSSGRITLVVHA